MRTVNVPAPVTPGVKVICPVDGLIEKVLFVCKGLFVKLYDGVAVANVMLLVVGGQAPFVCKGINMSKDNESELGSTTPLLYVYGWLMQIDGTGFTEK